MSTDDEPPYSRLRPRRARKLLKLKWGDEYEIKAPRSWPRRPHWSARARATGELLTAADPDELAGIVMRHYVARIAVEQHKRVDREERERPPPRLAAVSLRQFLPRLSMAGAGVRRPDD
jgi:hypothetical protein